MTAMFQDKYVFAQLTAFLNRTQFNNYVRKYDGDRYVKHFTCWNQLLAIIPNRSFIIRKTKRFAIPERAVYFLKTKRTAGVLPHPKNFRPAYAGIHIMQERSPDTIRTPFFSFCRFAPAFRASRYAASLNALYATTLCALTSLPRKARREPTYVFAFDASLFAFAFDTPPFALALLYPR